MAHRQQQTEGFTPPHFESVTLPLYQEKLYKYKRIFLLRQSVLLSSGSLLKWEEKGTGTPDI